MLFLREFHAITTSHTQCAGGQFSALLALGCRELGLSSGMLVRFDQQRALLQGQCGDNVPVAVLSGMSEQKVAGWKARLSEHTGQAVSNAKGNPDCDVFAAFSTCPVIICLPVYHNSELTGAMLFFGNRVLACDDSAVVTNENLQLLAEWFGVAMVREQQFLRLKKQESLLSQLETAANIGTWEYDIPSGSITWSSQTKKIHQVDEAFDPAIHQAIEFYKEGKSRERISLVVQRAIESGQSWEEELQLVTAQGECRWIKTHGTAEIQDGQCVRLFGTIQDVNDEVSARREAIRQRKIAEQALEDRSRLLGKISHELRTPLNGVMGMLQSLEDESRPEERQKKLSLALRSSDLLQRLINEVLDYTKVASDSFSLNKTRFEPDRLFDDLVSQFAPLAQEKGLSLHTDIRVDTRQPLYSDATRLQQVVANLLTNAIKFTDQGSITLVALLKTFRDKTNLLITVSDTGTGMTEQTLSSLFEPFIQGDKRVDAHKLGTGLGMAIVKEIVDRLDGEIEVSSRPGEGSCFDIVVPLDTSEQMQDNEPVSTDIDDPAAARSLSVLVVDDNEVNRYVVLAMLEQLNLSADVAVNGVEALKAAQAKLYDLILMDVVMPELDGIEASRQLVVQGLVHAGTVIAALTANTSDADRLAAERAGMHFFLAKPLVKPEMIRVINAAVRGRQLLHYDRPDIA
ncbi:ATP-binding protein [Alteromonas sp. CYL-A6]|uniref:ATP-binding protein n=1 Tax=Alteromonas nitratireducens TaxID=3390813 RepID=UPI0034BE89D6